MYTRGIKNVVEIRKMMNVPNSVEIYSIPVLAYW